MNDKSLLVAEWNAVQQSLKEIKKTELELRKRLLKELFPENVTGTIYTNVGDKRVKANFGLSYKVEEDALNIIGPELTDAAANCIKWKPSLIMKEYKALSDEDRDLLDECITCKPALPSVSIEDAE